MYIYTYIYNNFMFTANKESIEYYPSSYCFPYFWFWIPLFVLVNFRAKAPYVDATLG